MLQLVNAFAAPADTKKVGEWDSPPGQHPPDRDAPHRSQRKVRTTCFVLLIRGLVFKFQGSTEPGGTRAIPTGPPFLVQGQHDYHFGWHRQSYLALRPRRLDRGVLVGCVFQGSRASSWSDADLKNGLEANASINIHWGGKGLQFDVKTWSEGCQVINGSLFYLNVTAAISSIARRSPANEQWRGGRQSGQDARCLQRARRSGDRLVVRSRGGRREVRPCSSREIWISIRPSSRASRTRAPRCRGCWGSSEQADSAPW